MLTRWQSTITDIRGNVVPGAVLQIRRESDQALVTVYRDAAGTDPYPTAVVTANEVGYAYFYAAPDLYRIQSQTPAIDWREVNVGKYGDDTILSSRTINIPGDYPTLQAAWEWLMTKRLQPDVTITINMAPNDYSHDAAMLGHPDGRRINVIGAPLVGGFPAMADWQVTGFSPAQRAADNAANLAMMRARFPTRINCSKIFLDIRTGGFGPNLSNVLVDGTGSGVVGCYWYDTLMDYTNLALYGFSINAVLTNGGQVRGSNFAAFGSTSGFGLQVSDSSMLKILGTGAVLSNFSSGVYCKRGGQIEASVVRASGNNGHGFHSDDHGQIEASNGSLADMNSLAGVRAVNGGEVACSSITSQLNGTFGLQADAAGEIVAFSAQILNNVNDGIVATGVSTINANSSNIKGNQRGVSVTESATVQVRGATITENTSVGIRALGNASVYAVNAQITKNQSVGVLAQENGRIDVGSATISESTTFGIQATNGARISAKAATVTASGSNGVYVTDGGYIDVSGGTVTGNPRALAVNNGGDINADSATITATTAQKAVVTGAGTIRVTGVADMTSGDTSPALNTPFGLGGRALIYNQYTA